MPFSCLKSKYEKQLTKEERKEAIVSFLKNDFPLRFIVITTIMEMLLSFMAIGFQIASIILKSPLYFVGTG
jgi:hypothetical protein